MLARRQGEESPGRVDVLAPDDPAVVNAVQRIGDSAAVVRSLYQAVYAYERTGDVAVLKQFAGDALATVRVRNLPGYDKALKEAPDGPTGTGRPIDEIFAGLRP
jgi:hypothetical protein